MAADGQDDERDVEVTNRRLVEIGDPDSLVSGAALQQRLDHLDATAPEEDDIPAFCKVSTEARRDAWERNPPKAAPIKELTMAKPAKKTKGKEVKTDKTATLLSMLKGKGSTVEAMTKALDWLPHTLRARISRLPKDDKKIKIERSRVDGVTSYRIAS